MSEKVVYTGHFVENQEKLLEALPPQITEPGATIYAHHVTRDFEPPNGLDDVEVGRRRTLHITGHVVAEGVHVAVVESPDGEKISSNAHPHITIATAEGVPPVKSNDVLAEAKQNGTVIPIQPPIEFTTVEGYLNDNDEIHTS